MLTTNVLKGTAAAGLMVLGTAVGYTPNAQAASAFAVADLDWSSLSIVFLGNEVGPDLGALAENTVAGADNGIVSDLNSNSNPDWLGSFSSAVTPGNPNYVGQASVSLPALDTADTTVHAVADVFSKKAGWTVGAGSTGTRAADFTVDQSGFVVITINYSLSAGTGDGGTSLANDTASAKASALLTLANLSNTSSSSLQSTSSALVKSLFDPTNGELGGGFDQLGRSLAVIAFFEAGEAGHFEISVSTEVGTSSPAAVPVPAAGWLLGGALGMLSLRRRRAA